MATTASSLMPHRIILLAVFAVLLGESSFAQCVWGSFDGTRINYTEGVFTTGTDHAKLRALVTGNKASLATATPTITASYLSKIQVFYTSLLHDTMGTPTKAEMTLLQGWVKAGGTLIVSGDVIGLKGYQAMTGWLGMGNWHAGPTCKVNGIIDPLSFNLDIINNVKEFYYCTNALFSVGPGAEVLGNDVNYQPFLCLFDPTPERAGRVLVLGDHNLFTDPYIDNTATAQNTTLATNIVRWACKCPTGATAIPYGLGLAGRNGVPKIVASGRPIHGTQIQVTAGNSSGATSSGILLLGLQQTSVRYLGGTLLTRPDAIFPIVVPTAGFVLPVPVPDTPNLCGVQIHLQVLQLDSAASQGVSFTGGLRLTPGK